MRVAGVAVMVIWAVTACATSSQTGTGGTASQRSSKAPRPVHTFSGRVSVQNCPTATSAGKVTGYSMKAQGAGTRSATGLYCIYYPAAAPASSAQFPAANASFSLGVLDEKGLYANLAAAKSESRRLCRNHCSIADLPFLGPGAYEGFTSITSKGLTVASCIVWISDQHDYPVNITATTRRGGRYNYRGSMSQSAVCGLSQGLAELLMSGK
jgi:hypothetical protein